MAHSRRPAQGRRTGRGIAGQLRLIVAVPLVAVVAFAGLALYGTAGDVRRTDRLREMVALAGDAGRLAHALQNERAAATAVLASGSSPQSPTAALAAQLNTLASRVATTDTAADAYRQRRPSVEDADLLARIDAGLAGLPDLRMQVRAGPQTSASSVAFSYRILSADLIAYRESVARAGAPTDIADDLRAAAALSQTIEAIGQQEVAVLRAYAAGLLSPALRQEITATRTSFAESSAAFAALAGPRWLVWWEQASTGAEVLAAQRAQDRIGRALAGDRLVIDPSEWMKALAGWADRLYAVQQRVDEDLARDIVALRSAQLRQATGQAAGVALALILAIVVTSLVASRITRRLRRLHDEASLIAYDRLPAVVAHLRAAPPGTVRPDEYADRATGAAVVTGNDEVADVAQAFRAVHREAIRTAAEQAVMRSNVAEIFVHLSRREQRLVDAVLAQVDQVERDETDPDRLQQLYRLDHLATRMARINLSLLVLGGSGVARVRREDVPLAKVLQAGISQIEHYTRVRFGLVDDDMAVVATAVDEVVHLIAELLDNATAYSPPESEVWVTGRALGDRIIIQIADEGVGLPPERRRQLNALLQSPPSIDLAAVRAMGLTVVGHIAARYGIRVDLRAGPVLGTIAEVTLPKALFRLAPPQMIPEAKVDALTGTADDLGRAELGRDQRRRDEFGPEWVVTGNGRSAAVPGQRSAPRLEYATAPSTPAALFTPSAADTAELPIFREVNGWFCADGPSDAVTGDGAATRDGGGRSSGSTVDAGDPPGGTPGNWVTVADAGWRAAAEAAQPRTSGTTVSGLPLRDPQQQLVPGSAGPVPERPVAAKRDPAAVAAAMSAYARGVAGRRTAANTSTANTSAANTSTASTGTAAGANGAGANGANGTAETN